MTPFSDLSITEDDIFHAPINQPFEWESVTWIPIKTVTLKQVYEGNQYESTFQLFSSPVGFLIAKKRYSDETFSYSFEHGIYGYKRKTMKEIEDLLKCFSPTPEQEDIRIPRKGKHHACSFINIHSGEILKVAGSTVSRCARKMNLSQSSARALLFNTSLVYKGWRKNVTSP